MAYLRKTLPKNIAEILATGDLEQIAAEVNRCEIGATTRGYYKETLLHIVPCSDEVVRWLVERGEDINAEDRYRQRPLHIRAQRYMTEQIPLLLSLGAEIDAADYHGQTALHFAAENNDLQAIDMLLAAGADPTKLGKAPAGRAPDGHSAITFAVSNVNSGFPTEMLKTVERLLAAGARPSGKEGFYLKIMGKDHQRALARDKNQGTGRTEIGAALDRLYEICGVEPVAPIHVHDGVSPIAVADGPWRKAFSTLWDSLVPDYGQSDTAQGEAIRIAGRLSDELLGNGGGNWDQAYRNLVDGLWQIFTSGNPLPTTELVKAKSHLATLRTGAMDKPAIDQIRELAVEWVRLNPNPMPNPLPDSGR